LFDSFDSATRLSMSMVTRQCERDPLGFLEAVLNLCVVPAAIGSGPARDESSVPLSEHFKSSNLTDDGLASTQGFVFFTVTVTPDAKLVRTTTRSGSPA
jgi:hypothetical protein